LRERWLEKKAADGDKSAEQALNVFTDYFYKEAKPNGQGGVTKVGYARPIRDILNDMGYLLVKDIDVGFFWPSTQGYIAKSAKFDSEGGDIIIAFRGSTSFGDWMTNFNGDPVPFGDEETPDYEIGMVHKGFLEAFNSVRDLIIKYVYPLVKLGKPCRVLVTGHSLGGALATLTMAYLMLDSFDQEDFPENISQVRTVTFGNPKVGDAKFCEFVTEKMKENPKFSIVRLYNESDPVPQVPPDECYVHCVQATAISVDGRVFHPPAQGTEDQKKEIADAGDVTAFVNMVFTGPKIAIFHDILVYFHAVYAFNARCAKPA
jgi:hypothetical protein